MPKTDLPNPPYTIEGIMNDLDRKFGESNGEGDLSNTPPLIQKGTILADTQALLGQADSLRRSPSPYKIRSHRPLLRWILDPIKKLFHWGSRPYIDLLIEHQNRLFDHHNRINASLLNDLRHVHLRLDELDRGLDVEKAKYDLSILDDVVSEEKRLALMETFRGEQKHIGGTQYHYVEYFRDCPGQVLDVGCGRGEFLEVLNKEGIESWGCETNKLMAEVSRRPNGTHIVEKNAIDTLTEDTEPATLGGIFSAQVIEHMFPGHLLQFLKLSRDRIAPGGTIVLETLNPQSLGVLSKSYYRDLDHKQAIDPDYMAGLLELIGFTDVQLHHLSPFSEEDRLVEVPAMEEAGAATETIESINRAIRKLNDAIWGPQDFYVVGKVPIGPSTDSQPLPTAP